MEYSREAPQKNKNITAISFSNILLGYTQRNVSQDTIKTLAT
jgi:hypothetical protein